LERELWRRECRNSLAAWCIEALAPVNQTPARHHRLLIRELEAVARGETDRLMINMPPGSAKSTYASVLFPAWLLAQRPGLDIIGASNTSTMAETFSRRVIALARDHSALLGYGLTRESVEQWGTTQRGQYRAVGVGGAMVGHRADLALIDDPTRSRADAESEVVRESQWNWFTSDLRTRLKPEAAIVVIMTRWHADDLGGRLLERQAGLWRVVSLPAIAGEDDALGRAPGEWLWDNEPSYPYAAELRRVHAEYQAAGATRDWAALYQQSPRPAEGALFKPHLIETLDEAPPCVTTARSWDLAATKQMGTNDPDWTVGLKLGRTKEGRYIVLDIVRLRGGPDEVGAAITNTAGQDGRQVQIRLSEDPGQAGKHQVLHYTRALAGFNIISERETGDKATRAAPIASQVNIGNVSMVRAPWNAAFRDELAAFPAGGHDDQVDGLSGAFEMVGMKAPPIQIAPGALARFGVRR
jgi:predicted phage terminase large subunit-like protein